MHICANLVPSKFAAHSEACLRKDTSSERGTSLRNEGRGPKGLGACHQDCNSCAGCEHLPEHDAREEEPRSLDELGVELRVVKIRKGELLAIELPLPHCDANAREHLPATMTKVRVRW